MVKNSLKILIYLIFSFVFLDHMTTSLCNRTLEDKP